MTRKLQCSVTKKNSIMKITINMSLKIIKSAKLHQILQHGKENNTNLTQIFYIKSKKKKYPLENHVRRWNSVLIHLNHTAITENHLLWHLTIKIIKNVGKIRCFLIFSEGKLIMIKTMNKVYKLASKTLKDYSTCLSILNNRNLDLQKTSINIQLMISNGGTSNLLCNTCKTTVIVEIRNYNHLNWKGFLNMRMINLLRKYASRYTLLIYI